MAAACNFLTSTLGAIPAFFGNQVAKLSQSLGFRKVKQEPKDSPRRVIIQLLDFLEHDFGQSEGAKTRNKFIFEVSVDALGHALKAHPEYVTTILEKYGYDLAEIPSHIHRALDKIRKEIGFLELRFHNELNLYLEDWSTRIRTLANFFVNLNELTLSKPGNLSTVVGWVADSFSNHKHLSSLVITDARITAPKAMRDIVQRLPSVSKIIFDSCGSLGMIEELSNKKNLVEIAFVNNCFISIDTLSHLAKFPALTILTIKNCPIIQKGELPSLFRKAAPGSFQKMIRIILSPDLCYEGLKEALPARIQLVVQKPPKPKIKLQQASTNRCGLLVVAGTILLITYWKGPNLLKLLPFRK